jgi:hypothetical protein
MANYVLVRHKVRDFSEWKPIYDAHHSTREEAGLRELYMMRSADDPNEVILLMEAADLDRAKAFGASADLREAMQRAGVLDQPNIYYLKG